MPKATPDTIILRGQLVRKEGKDSAGGIVPGDLVARNSSGDLIVHGTAAANAAKAFAIENTLAGKGIADAYVQDENVVYGVFNNGAEVYGRVAASAAAIVIGDFLESAGDGTVRKVATSAATADTARSSIVGIALEAVDNSGGGSIVRIKLEVI